MSGHLVCDGLVRIFKTEDVEVVALQGLDLSVDRGELLAIVGASGSGRSTVLNILSGLDTPTAGIARVAGYDLVTMNARRRLRYRCEVVGFVWQQTARNLLPYLTARQNIELPMTLAGHRGREAVANDPEVLFADEPTGELDGATAADVFAALRSINAELGVTIEVSSTRLGRCRPRPVTGPDG